MVEGKSSFIPKPRRPGSIDRASLEARRPSGIRSSSAEPPRATIASSRLSREASATKIPLNKRSRSQQGESSRYGQASMTPLRKFSRPTTTPQRTPTDERFDRSWQTALDRALAFVTVKDQRPLTNPAWQRSEYHRVQEALAVRGGGNGMALTRPLTIAQFVDITAELLHSITRDTNLNTDNYVGKLPHTAKRLLYPGAISKSWLKTVNTLHAFPHALALIVYLLDLVTRIEQPVTLEWLYADKGELAQLKRQYVKNCWARFQTGENCDDLRVEYLSELRGLLGNDEQKIAELEDNIKKFQLCLDDESERAARADEARRIDRRAALLAALRSENGGRVATRSATDAAAAANRDAADLLKNLDYEIEQMALEEQQLSKELQEQSMSVEERTHLLEEVDYANRVQESKRTLAEQIAKMVQTKENDLALWQKRTMDSCMEYNQGLIHASARFPDLAPLVDEKELMSTGCAEAVSSAVTSLKQKLASLNEQNAERERSRNKQKRDKSNKVVSNEGKIRQVQGTDEHRLRRGGLKRGDVTEAETSLAQ